jgi:predicted O-methyltransferase YrrM
MTTDRYTLVRAEVGAAGKGPSLENWCNRLAHAALPSDFELLDAAGLVGGHPWASLVERALGDPGSVAYYRYLYGLARLANPRRVLEIGTGFGLSGAAFILGAPSLGQFISLDLGVFTAQYEIVRCHPDGWAVMQGYRSEDLKADGRNIAFAREVLGRLVQRLRSRAQLSFFQVNTQPEGTDNFDVRVSVPRWSEVKELVADLEAAPIDLLFIDGKHMGDGFYHDFKSFFPYLRPGGLVICDDVHDASFPYDWAGQTLASFQRVLEEFDGEIADSYLWPFPQVADGPGKEPTLRPFGLIRKRGLSGNDGALGGLASLCIHELIGVRQLADVDPEQTIQHLRLLKGHGALASRLESLAREERAAEHLSSRLDRPALLSAAAGLPLEDEQAARLVGFLSNHAGLVAELERLGLGDEAAARLALVKDRPALVAAMADVRLADDEAARLVRFVTGHAALVAELEWQGLGEEAVRRLAFVREHPAILAATLELQAGDDGAARLVRFVARNAALLAELRAMGLGEEAGRRLAFVKDHPALLSVITTVPLSDDHAARLVRLVVTHGTLLAELEREGFGEEAGRRLAFVREQPAILAATQEPQPGDDDPARWVRFARQHSALLAYLASRPALAADLERLPQEIAARWRPGLVPIKLLWLAAKLVPGYVSGRYRR